MSTVAFGALTTARKREDPTIQEEPAGLSTYIDMFAALVPAEVLALHAFVLTLATGPSMDTEGRDVVVITEDAALEVTFWVLVAMAPFLFLAGRWLTAPTGKWFDWRWDFLRMAVPAAAFVGWTMIQKVTAFDAVFDWSGNGRIIAAALAAPVMATISVLLSRSAHNEPAPTPSLTLTRRYGVTSQGEQPFSAQPRGVWRT